MKTIIFSKDRPAQLSLLLRSIEKFCPWLNPVVLYTTSDLHFQQGYNECFNIHKVENRHEEKSFRSELLDMIDPKEKYTQFLTDDDVFINNWPKKPFDERLNRFDTERIAGLSLRLHKGVTYSYTRNENDPIPPIMGDAWRWQRAQGHWNYPFSVDGDVYRTAHVLRGINMVLFNNPNQFEGSMVAAMTGIFRDYPRFMCYDVPKIINIPWNRVQNAVGNRSEEVNAEDMNDQYLKGYDIKPDSIYHIKSNTFHQPVKLEWEEHESKV